MANSADLDQTSRSASTLFAQAYLSERKLRINTVCEQEKSRLARKATESDKGFSYSAIYSTEKKSLSKRTTET